jgi:hypothetical protein
VLGSSGLTPEQWASAVETPPVIEAKALDGSASKHYVKVARKFEENVLRYQNSDRNLRQVRADIDEMKNSSVKFRYPPGTRPWKSPGDGVQLDQLWIPSKEEDYVVSIVVPKGSTRREVLQQLHHCHEMSRKDVHAEALCEHVNLLKPLTTRSAFFRACAEFKRDELEDLDLAHGRQVTANGKLALKKCEDLYSSVIDRIRAKRTSDKKSEEEKARIEKEKEEVLKKLDPKAALQGMVQAAVQKAVGEVKMDVDATPTDVRPSTVHDHDDNLIKALRPTNGQSPEGASGSNMSKRQKKTLRKSKSVNKETNQELKGKKPKSGTVTPGGRNTNLRKWNVWKPSAWNRGSEFNQKKQPFKVKEDPEAWRSGWSNRWPQWSSNKSKQWGSMRKNQVGAKGKGRGW